jgi:DNA mismatch repair protein MutH
MEKRLINRKEAVKNLSKYVGKDLFDYSKHFNIPTNQKGWKGHVLERLAGLTINSSRAPNGDGFELKSISYKKLKNGEYVPKESMKITMVNNSELENFDFYDSHCWKKLKKLILCVVFANKKFQLSESFFVNMYVPEMENYKLLLSEIENDYNLIKENYLTNKSKKFSSSTGKWIQTRTSGKGYGSITRSFYARPKLIKELISSNEITFHINKYFDNL